MGRPPGLLHQGHSCKLLRQHWQCCWLPGTAQKQAQQQLGGVVRRHLPALRHEPLRALTDGADGLDCLRAIVQQAPRWLRPGGTLLLEHGYNQRAAVDALLRNAGFADVQAVSDAAGIARVAVGRLTNRAGVRPV